MNLYGYSLEQAISIILIILLASVFIITFIWSRLSFDKLVQFQYKNYHSSWEKDGKPRGGLWTPRDELSLPLGWGTRGLELIWLLSPPNWQYNDPRAKRLMIRYRILTLLYFLSFASMLTGIAVLMMLG
jgi:hypothetical protein